MIPQRPNILLIVVDCLRADRCTPDSRMPNLRLWPELVKNGTSYEQTIAVASTTPVCFASMLTGLYPHRHGIRSLQSPGLAPRTATLLPYLHNAGYSTCALTTGPLLPYYHLDRDFTRYEHRPREENVYSHWGQKLRQLLTQPQLDAPWFTLLHLFELHRPRQHELKSKRASAEQRYDDAWRRLDAWLAELLDLLPRDNTIIALTADHGESIYRRSDMNLTGRIARHLREYLGLARQSREWKNHGYFVYDELVKVPFALAGPNIPAGRSVNAQISQVDILPTLIDAAGLTHQSVIDGQSALPLAHDPSLPCRNVYLESGWHEDPIRDWHALRSPDWKYVEHPRTGKNLQPDPFLFDLAHDPHELRNVIRKHPDVALELRSELDKLVFGHVQETQQQTAASDEEQQELATHLKHLGYL